MGAAPTFFEVEFMLCFCESIYRFPVCCVRPECVSGWTLVEESFGFLFCVGEVRLVGENLLQRREEVKRKGILIWCRLWLSECLKVWGVGWTILGMRGCVLARIKMKRFIFGNRSETSGFCDVSLRLVSLLHLNQ